MKKGINAGDFILEQGIKLDSGKRDFRSVTLSPDEIRQFGANTKDNSEMAIARRIKERSKVIVKEMEEKLKAQREKEEIQNTQDTNIPNTPNSPSLPTASDTTQKFDPNNMDFSVFSNAQR